MTQGACAIPNCERPIRVVGLRLCSPHYKRWKRHGDPLGGGVSRRVDPFVRFADQVAWDGHCLIWTGATVTGGSVKVKYGRFKIDGRNRRVHRWVYEREHGPIPSGLELRHTCDVSLCVHLPHLLTGTHTENMHDSIARGRAWWLTRESR